MFLIELVEVYVCSIIDCVDFAQSMNVMIQAEVQSITAMDSFLVVRLRIRRHGQPDPQCTITLSGTYETRNGTESIGARTS